MSNLLSCRILLGSGKARAHFALIFHSSFRPNVCQQNQEEPAGETESGFEAKQNKAHQFYAAFSLGRLGLKFPISLALGDVAFPGYRLEGVHAVHFLLAHQLFHPLPKSLRVEDRRSFILCLSDQQSDFPLNRGTILQVSKTSEQRPRRNSSWILLTSRANTVGRFPMIFWMSCSASTMR